MGYTATQWIPWVLVHRLSSFAIKWVLWIEVIFMDYGNIEWGIQ